MNSELIQEAEHAFPEAAVPPPMSLRGGNARDDYQSTPDYDPVADQPSDAYLAAHPWGIAHLDPTSWRHYLPRLIAYSLSHLSDPRVMVVDAFLTSLRPPDRDPPRFASLTSQQRQVLTKFLDALAFTKDSAWTDEAMLALEEYWAPGSLYGNAALEEKKGADGA